MALRDAEYLALQVEALFTHDAHGHILATNEPSPQPAPRVFLGRSREDNVWRYRSDLSNAVIRALERLAHDEPVLSDLRVLPRTLLGVLEAIGADVEHATVRSGPAYRFPDTFANIAASPGVRRLTRADIPLLARMGWDTVDALERDFEGLEPIFAALSDGEVVSVCHSARNAARAAEAGVETVTEYRGRGYAPAVVAAWARAVRAKGRVPLYSTSWENAASQAVARTLGLTQYGADFSIF